MLRKPSAEEWNMDHFPPSRRAYLEQASFESLVVRVADEAVVTEAWVEPYNSPPPGVPKNAARQIIYRLSVSEQTLDIFFNAPDGLRGRYYQGPDHGFEATRRLRVRLRIASVAESA